jgi:DNA-directed RNA polymerase specialized sigma24 family protein
MNEDDPGSVTYFLGRLQAGETSAAAQGLWDRYFTRLAVLARSRLAGTPQRDADEEDVALSALNSLFAGLKAGRFPNVTDRTTLWPLLVTLTSRKAINQVRRQRAAKRNPATETPHGRIDSVFDTEPTPQFALELAEETNRLLRLLPNETFVTIARSKLEGVTNDEIAERLGVSTRTIIRKLNLIRSLWRQEPNR